MACRADKGDQNLSGAVKISVKRITEKAERVEEGNQMQVRNGLFQCLGIVCSEKNRAGRAGQQEKGGGTEKTEEQKQFCTLPKGLPYPLFFLCAHILCHHDGGGRRAAVPEGIDKALCPCGRRVGGDSGSGMGFAPPPRVSSCFRRCRSCCTARTCASRFLRVSADCRRVLSLLGQLTVASYAWISEAASDFHSQYPGIELQIRGGYSTQLLEALRARKVDLCFISEREGDHRWIPLQEDQVMAWIPKDSDLDKNGAVPVAAFAREPYIEIYPGMDIDNLRVLKACKVQPNTRFSTMDSYAACAMVEAGLGITMNNGMNRPTVDDGIKIVPLDPPQKVMVGIAAMRDLSPAAERFLDFLLKKQR